MIDVREHPDGCVLAVRAQPGARKAGVLGVQAGALKVAVVAVLPFASFPRSALNVTSPGPRYFVHRTVRPMG